ncbi:predicted protein [Histoplasma capsulatum G186AR]|uniref:Uncharacterized protein n=1 Tax=Ajellomyces capsulatus (strain G186AR / H82 / ATCC MYA-2454 / RMSCC 2432) TaxID=447093 RepID=C0NEU2_AJECG|nr:uncharacterized protein HCBG_01408 [Histoplasma capsulatum G186AR]EEH09763.1 predicted protein [Histoplasma capsulatum G186AR]
MAYAHLRAHIANIPALHSSCLILSHFVSTERHSGSTRKSPHSDITEWGGQPRLSHALIYMYGVRITWTRRAEETMVKDLITEALPLRCLQRANQSSLLGARQM